MYNSKWDVKPGDELTPWEDQFNATIFLLWFIYALLNVVRSVYVLISESMEAIHSRSVSTETWLVVCTAYKYAAMVLGDCSAFSMELCGNKLGARDQNRSSLQVEELFGG